MSELTFTVPGVAVPKGSRSMFRGRSVESSKRWPAWKLAVGHYAIQARSDRKLKRFEDGVTLTVTFMFARPKRNKHPKHISRPDLDKLVRGVCDALTGVVWIDDSQVDVVMAVKRYCHEDEEPCALIRVADST